MQSWQCVQNLICENTKDEKIHDGQVLGLLVSHLCYGTSKRCGWFVGKKVTVCHLLVGEFLRKEGIGVAVQTGATWKRSFL